MFHTRTWTLFHVRGIPIRAHWSLLLVVGYLAFALTYQFRAVAEFAGVDARHVLPPVAWGIVLAVCVFASILLHELAHAFMALRYGGEVRGITLMLVGGVSELSRIPRRPAHEAAMAAVGPATSLLLALAFGAVFATGRTLPDDVRMALFYLAATNAVLNVFNLLPAFPMDGGRILRALFATRLTRTRATTIAARVGQVCAVLLAVVAVWTANLLLGVVVVMIFLGARGEAFSEQVRASLDGVGIADIVPMAPLPVNDVNQSIQHAAERMRSLQRPDLVAVDASGAPVGVVDIDDLRRAPAADSVGVLVSHLPRRHVEVPSDAPATDAIDRAATDRADHVIVTDPHSGLIVGVVTSEDLARAIRLHAS